MAQQIETDISDMSVSKDKNLVTLDSSPQSFIRRLALRLHIGNHGLAALLTIIAASLLRIVLTAQGWPITNSDEDTIGIMGIHIAYQGAHPTFFYGQNYMGPIEAYLGSFMFHLFGVSVFSLRLGTILLFALFLASTYLLASLLYTKKLALVTLVLLSLGSSAMLIRQVSAIGGYQETLLFGSLAFLLASWLALTSVTVKTFSYGKRWLHWAAFGGWGCVVGLGFWSDPLILPFILMSGLLLLLCCWREWRTWAPVLLAIGLIIGGLPLIIYNLHAVPGQDSLTVMWNLHRIGSSVSYPLSQEIAGAVSVSIPTATGNPICPVIELSFLGGDNSLPSQQCTLLRSSWGIGYLLLLASAVLLTLVALWKFLPKLRFRPKADAPSKSLEEQQSLIRHLARLLLLGSAGLALAVFVLSPAPVVWPSIYSRYLIGLLIATPAVLWPLWSSLSKLRLPLGGFALLKATFSLCLMLIIGTTLLLGTLVVFQDVPTAQAIDRQEADLITRLEQIGATHIYSEYWTCNRITFQSDQQIICGVLLNHLELGYNRYMPYYAIVKADPHSAYVFPIGSPQAWAIAQQVVHSSKKYRHFTFDGYVIYQPVG